MENAFQEIFDKGYCIVQNAFDGHEIAKMRREVLDNLHLMSNTRRAKAAFHIAGFHRSLDLEHLHLKVSGNRHLLNAMKAIYDQGSVIALGLTDITVNRSQPWHTDLLRGKYAKFLDMDTCWNVSNHPCLKALVYLQDGESLKVIPGSHLNQIDLSSDANVVPQDEARVERVRATAGDIILMDIRLIHRGATDEQMEAKTLDNDAKILISTVFGEKCVFRRIRPPIPTTSGHLFRGIRPPVTRCREAACFGYQS